MGRGLCRSQAAIWGCERGSRTVPRTASVAAAAEPGSAGGAACTACGAGRGLCRSQAAIWACVLRFLNGEMGRAEAASADHARCHAPLRSQQPQSPGRPAARRARPAMTATATRRCAPGALAVGGAGGAVELHFPGAQPSSTAYSARQVVFFPDPVFKLPAR